MNRDNRSFLKIAAAAVIVAAGLAAIVNFFIFPILDNNAARNQIGQISAQSGEIQVSNRDLVVFAGQKIPTANVDQKALAQGEIVTSPPGIIFENGKPAEKLRKTVVVYLNFSDQRSRDFLLINQNTLKTAVQTGEISLKIAFIPNGKPLSIYSAEALSESANTSPKQTWNYLLGLLKFAATGPDLDTQKMSERIAEYAKNNNVSDVDSQSIMNGTFASWILSVGNDGNVKNGFNSPLIVINGKTVDLTLVNVNDTTEFARFLKK